jgi:hypothetical protein
LAADVHTLLVGAHSVLGLAAIETQRRYLLVRLRKIVESRRIRHVDALSHLREFGHGAVKVVRGGERVGAFGERSPQRVIQLSRLAEIFLRLFPSFLVTMANPPKVKSLPLPSVVQFDDFRTRLAGFIPLFLFGSGSG